MVFVDTGVWFALLVSKDPNHQRTTEWFANLSEQVITSDYIVDETLTLLLMRGERKKAIEFGNLVIVGSLANLHKITEDQFNFQSTKTHLGQFRLDTSSLPENAIETKTDTGGPGNPVMRITLNSDLEIELVLRLASKTIFPL